MLLAHKLSLQLAGSYAINGILSTNLWTFFLDSERTSRISHVDKENNLLITIQSEPLFILHLGFYILTRLQTPEGPRLRKTNTILPFPIEKLKDLKTTT